MTTLRPEPIAALVLSACERPLSCGVLATERISPGAACSRSSAHVPATLIFFEGTAAGFARRHGGNAGRAASSRRNSTRRFRHSHGCGALARNTVMPSRARYPSGWPSRPPSARRAADASMRGSGRARRDRACGMQARVQLPRQGARRAPLYAARWHWPSASDEQRRAPIMRFAAHVDSSVSGISGCAGCSRPWRSAFRRSFGENRS